MPRFRAKRDQPKPKTALAHGVMMFTGALMKCGICGKEQNSDPAVSSNWRGFVLDGTEYYACTDHFPADDAGAKAFEEAYYSVMKALIEKHKRTTWKQA